MARFRFAGGWPVDVGIAVVLAVLAACGFARALTRQYTFDAIAYAWQIEQFGLTGRPGWLFHPHHLLFNSIAYLWWRAVQGLPGFERALAAQQLLSAVAGGAAVALCYAATRQATGSRLLALGVAALIGAGLGLWTIATDGGIYALGFALCAATIGLAMRLLAKPTPGRAAALGVVAAIAALVHQMHVLLAPAVAMALLLGARTRRQQAPLSLATLGTYACILAGTYGLAARARGHESAAAIGRWLTVYGQDGRWWNFHVAHNLRLGLHALARAFTADPDGLLARVEALGRANLNSVLLGAAAFLLLASLYRGRQLLLCLVWLVPYVAFFTVWVPGYPAYWEPMAFGLLLVLALLVESFARALAARAFPLGALVRLGALAICCLGAWELWAGSRPLIERRRQERANPYLVIARAVEANTRGRDEARGRPSDLVLISGTGYYAPVEIYIPYFARRNLVTLAGALKHHGPGAGHTRPEAIDWLRARIRQSWRRGAQVYVFQDLLGSPAAFRTLERRYGMTATEAQAVMRDFRLEPAFAIRGEPVYRLAQGAAPQMASTEGAARQSPVPGTRARGHRGMPSGFHSAGRWTRLRWRPYRSPGPGHRRLRRWRLRRTGRGESSANDLRLHFGLGAASRADCIEIRWPSGRQEQRTNVPADRLLTIIEGTARSSR